MSRIPCPVDRHLASPSRTLSLENRLCVSAIGQAGMIRKTRNMTMTIPYLLHICLGHHFMFPLFSIRLEFHHEMHVLISFLRCNCCVYPLGKLNHFFHIFINQKARLFKTYLENVSEGFKCLSCRSKCTELVERYRIRILEST